MSESYEERYRNLFESIDAGVCVIEMIYDTTGKPVDYRFLEVNPAFERQTGLKYATRKTMREHVPDHEQHWFEIYGRIAETGRPERFVQPAQALMGGWYEVYAYRVGGEGSRKVAILFNDITERVRAVETLREADLRKDQFLATLAHELKNPLAPIRNALTMLRLRGPPDPELQQARELIDRQVGHLVRLVDDLLDVSRITFDKVELRREPVDLRAVAQDALATSQPLLEGGHHRVVLRLSAEPLWVDGDRVRLSQVVSNLLNNAARYTPEGGEITLETRRDGGDALVSVQDTGIGIEPAMLERVFEPFMQLGAGRGGIGLGLALAKRLAELHGGRVSAHSDGSGHGSRFIVHLPLTEAAPSVAAAQDRGLLDAPRRRFLVVDDNIDAASSQVTLLRMLGHEAESAFDGAEALTKAAAFRPQVVLLDLGMPGMDGFEVARRLRETPEGREAKIIAQTGWNQAEDRRRTAQAGFDAHLSKPVEIATLMETLARP
jgi:PAS domain S-box-containing protein